MKGSISISLVTTPEQGARLADLQRTFSELCNALTPLVHRTRCWSRVTLHHLAYHSLRASFPQVGSQIVCNAIYSVSRAYRLISGHFPGSRKGEGGAVNGLPLLRFRRDAPVFLDSHTLSFRGGALSIYTLVGRIKVTVDLTPEESGELATRKIREIMLFGDEGGYRLTFVFSEDAAKGGDVGREALGLPNYLMMDSAGGAGESVPNDANKQGRDLAETDAASGAIFR